MMAQSADSNPKARPVHYRPEQFITAPFEILTDLELTDGDRRMLLALCSFAIGKSVVWPLRQTLADRAGVDISNVSKRIRRLIDLGWVTVRQRGQHSNQYFLHLPARLNRDAAGESQLQALRDAAEAAEASDAAYDGPFDDVSDYESPPEDAWGMPL